MWSSLLEIEEVTQMMYVNPLLGPIIHNFRINHVSDRDRFAVSDRRLKVIGLKR